MRIFNYNDHIRYYIYNHVKEQDSKEYNELYKRIKANNKDSKILAGILYETAYVCCIMTLAFSPDSEEEIENLAFLQEFDDIEEFIFVMDEAIFDNLCDDFLYFLYSDLYSKKRMLSFIPNDDEYLKKAYPCYFLDVLYYSNKCDAGILIEGYYDRLNKGDKAAFFNSVKSGVEELYILESEDFFAYKYIILDMIESFYKYHKYMIANGIKEDSIDNILNEIEEDLNGFIYGLSKIRKILKLIIEGYIKYNILSPKDMEMIDIYFKEDKNKEEITKVLKKCNKLKNEN